MFVLEATTKQSIVEVDLPGPSKSESSRSAGRADIRQWRTQVKTPGIVRCSERGISARIWSPGRGVHDVAVVGVVCVVDALSGVCP